MSDRRRNNRRKGGFLNRLWLRKNTFQEGNRHSHTSCSTLSEQDIFEKREVNTLNLQNFIHFILPPGRLFLWNTRRGHTCHTIDTEENLGCGGSSCIVVKMWKLVEKYFIPVTISSCYLIIDSISHAKALKARLFLFQEHMLFIKILLLSKERFILKDQVTVGYLIRLEFQQCQMGNEGILVSCNVNVFFVHGPGTSSLKQQSLKCI